MGSRDIGSGRRYSNMNKSIVQQRQDNIICAHLTCAPNTAVRKNNHIYDNSSENNRTIYLHNVKMPIFQALIDLITDDVVRHHLSNFTHQRLYLQFFCHFHVNHPLHFRRCQPQTYQRLSAVS